MRIRCCNNLARINESRDADVQINVLPLLGVVLTMASAGMMPRQPPRTTTRGPVEPVLATLLEVVPDDSTNRPLSHWTADCGLRTVDCGLWTVDCKKLKSAVKNYVPGVEVPHDDVVSMVMLTMRSTMRSVLHCKQPSDSWVVTAFMTTHRKT